MKLLYLSEQQMLAAGAADAKRCNDTLEEMFRLIDAGDYRMGGEHNDSHGMRLMYPDQSDIPGMPLNAPGRWFTVMPAYLGGDFRVVGVKTYGANQDNPRHGIPRSILMMSLLDAETGAPLAYMSANVLSAMRTGSASGLAAKYLSRADARKIAIIGPGTMARYSLDAIMVERPGVQSISVLGRSRENLDLFRSHCLERHPQLVDYEECATVADACRDADIVLTATTQSPTFAGYPHVPQSALKDGAAVIVVSALRVDRAIFEPGSDVVHVADLRGMYSEPRNFDAQPQSDDGTCTYKGGLGIHLANGGNTIDFPALVASGRAPDWGTSVRYFASGGLPTEDVAWAWRCYERALELGLGIELEVF